jgi:hypothetical protein
MTSAYLVIHADAPSASLPFEQTIETISSKLETIVTASGVRAGDDIGERHPGDRTCGLMWEIQNVIRLEMRLLDQLLLGQFFVAGDERV